MRLAPQPLQRPERGVVVGPRGGLARFRHRRAHPIALLVDGQRVGDQDGARVPVDRVRRRVRSSVNLGFGRGRAVDGDARARSRASDARSRVSTTADRSTKRVSSAPPLRLPSARVRTICVRWSLYRFSARRNAVRPPSSTTSVPPSCSAAYIPLAARRATSVHFECRL